MAALRAVPMAPSPVLVEFCRFSPSQLSVSQQLPPVSLSLQQSSWRQEAAGLTFSSCISSQLSVCSRTSGSIFGGKLACVASSGLEVSPKGRRRVPAATWQCPGPVGRAAGSREGHLAATPGWQPPRGGSGGVVLAKRGAREEQTYPAPKRLPKEEEDTKTDLDFEEVSEEEVQAFLQLELQSDSGIPATRHYECVFLIHEDNYEDVPEIIQKVKDKITEFKGTVWRLNDWGLRRMAYKIKKASKANYILLNFEILPAQMGEFEKMLLSDERIIRHLVMKKKGPETKDYPPPPEWGEKVDSEDEYDWSEDEEEEEEDGPEWAYEGEEGDEDDDEEWEEGKESGGTQEDGGVKAKAKDSKDTVPKKNSVASKTRR